MFLAKKHNSNSPRLPEALHGLLITWMLFSEGSTNRDEKKLQARRSVKRLWESSRKPGYWGNVGGGSMNGLRVPAAGWFFVFFPFLRNVSSSSVQKPLAPHHPVLQPHQPLSSFSFHLSPFFFPIVPSLIHQSSSGSGRR